MGLIHSRNTSLVIQTMMMNSVVLILLSFPCTITSFMASKVPGYRPPPFWAALEGKSMAEKVLENPKWPPAWPYDDKVDFAVQDSSVDEIFYEQPRLVYHIDDFCVQALTEQYTKLLSDDDDILDICSSWVSHYPQDFKGKRVAGLGMNEYELSQNKQLTEYTVQNLNKEPKFPYEDASFDKVWKICCIRCYH